MIDLKAIRKNPSILDESMKRRGEDAVTDQILKMDEDYREILRELQECQSRRNAIAKEFPLLKKEGKDTKSIEKEAEAIKERITDLDKKSAELGLTLQDITSRIPNILDESVPFGESEDNNVVLRTWGNPRNFKFKPLPHFDMFGGSNLIDFDAGVKLSGSRFVVLRGALARLERAIAQFMLDVHTTEFGYTEVSVPIIVNEKTVYGTGKLPKSADDMFKLTNNSWLIPTAEVPVTYLVADEILDESNLPLRFTSFTPCFRSEAGAAGKDTRGMIRVHQFYKVELVSITTANQSDDELERMTNCAESILQRLELPYRVIVLCSGDTGFGASKTYDLEVWLPSFNTYREISSCSNCKDFQARRMNARYRNTQNTDKTINVAHTLNGSGLAVGRTLVAILENYQQEDGSVLIPEVLRSYMGGLEVIQG